MTTGFWVILLTVLIYGLAHSILASYGAKRRARQWFGTNSERWFRLFYNFIAAITLLPVLVLPVVLVDKELYSIPFPWVILTISIQLLAIAALVLGLRQTGLWSFVGLRQLIREPDITPTPLVTGGLYRWVRHPLYTAGLIFIWFSQVMTYNLLALFIGLTIYIVIGAIYEERKLEREYGQAYRDYQARTPMLIPGLKIRK